MFRAAVGSTRNMRRHLRTKPAARATQPAGSRGAPLTAPGDAAEACPEMFGGFAGHARAGDVRESLLKQFSAAGQGEADAPAAATTPATTPAVHTATPEADTPAGEGGPADTSDAKDDAAAASASPSSAPKTTGTPPSDAPTTAEPEQKSPTAEAAKPPAVNDGAAEATPRPPTPNASTFASMFRQKLAERAKETTPANAAPATAAASGISTSTSVPSSVPTPEQKSGLSRALEKAKEMLERMDKKGQVAAKAAAPLSPEVSGTESTSTSKSASTLTPGSMATETKAEAGGNDSMPASKTSASAGDAGAKEAPKGDGVGAGRKGGHSNSEEEVPADTAAPAAESPAAAAETAQRSAHAATVSAVAQLLQKRVRAPAPATCNSASAAPAGAATGEVEERTNSKAASTPTSATNSSSHACKTAGASASPATTAVGAVHAGAVGAGGAPGSDGGALATAFLKSKADLEEKVRNLEAKLKFVMSQNPPMAGVPLPTALHYEVMKAEAKDTPAESISTAEDDIPVDYVGCINHVSIAGVASRPSTKLWQSGIVTELLLTTTFQRAEVRGGGLLTERELHKVYIHGETAANYVMKHVRQGFLVHVQGRLSGYPRWSEEEGKLVQSHAINVHPEVGGIVTILKGSTSSSDQALNEIEFAKLTQKHTKQGGDDGSDGGSKTNGGASASSA